MYFAKPAAALCFDYACLVSNFIHAFPIYAEVVVWTCSVEKVFLEIS